MKLTRAILYSLSFVSGCGLVAFGLFRFGADLKAASIAEGEYSVWAAYHQKEANRWSALKAMAEVESKRTQVEIANQKALYAETRLQRACTKLKGRC